MKNKENIVLIGMPAVGKSTVGKLLASKLNFDFIDSDDIIENNEKKTLAQIICKKGLSQFLKIEEKHVSSINCTHHVIATGGSVVYSSKIMNHLSKNSLIIYLNVDLGVLLTRLDDMTARGVAIDPGKNIEDLYTERTPLYETFCHLKIDCQSMTADQITKKILPYF